jgi:hypothetical protein
MIFIFDTKIYSAVSLSSSPSNIMCLDTNSTADHTVRCSTFILYIRWPHVWPKHAEVTMCIN